MSHSSSTGGDKVIVFNHAHSPAVIGKYFLMTALRDHLLP